MKHLLFNILVIAAFTSTATSAEMGLKDIKRMSEICMNSGKSIVEIRQCLAKAQLQAESLLDSEYRQIINKSSSDQIATNRLQKSQKSWFMYRLDECAYESSDLLGGNGDGLIYDKCIFDMTMERINKISSN